MIGFGVFIVFAMIAVTVVEPFTIQQLKDGEAFARDCILKVGINPLTVNRLRKGDFSKDNEKSQCFVKCFFEKSGFMQDDELVEKVIIDKLSEQESREKVQEIYDLCKDIKGSTSCQTAFKVYECYLSNKN